MVQYIMSKMRKLSKVGVLSYLLPLTSCLLLLPVPAKAQTVKNITVSQEQSYTDHISLEGDVTDKEIMVKFVFD